MNSKQVIQDIRAAVTEAKSSNRKTVRITALERFLSDLEADIDAHGEISKVELDTRLAEFTAANERNIATYNAEVSSNLEMFRSVILAGQSALKGALLINGGAAIAVLAFIGNLAAKGSGHEEMIDLFSLPLFLFTLGVLCGAVSFGTTYMSQFCYSREKTLWIGHVFQVITISTVIAAYCLFFTGSYSAKSGFEYKDDANQAVVTTPGAAAPSVVTP